MKTFSLPTQRATCTPTSRYKESKSISTSVIGNKTNTTPIVLATDNTTTS